MIFKHAPAASNPNALLAHEAALAAGAQGKFWEMHDTLFENQTQLTRADLLGYAKALGLNLAAFQLRRQGVNRKAGRSGSLETTSVCLELPNAWRVPPDSRTVECERILV